MIIRLETRRGKTVIFSATKDNEIYLNGEYDLKLYTSEDEFYQENPEAPKFELNFYIYWTQKEN
jgi:hypothetical protein